MARCERTDGELREIATRFDIAGDLVDVRPYGSGHINYTYVSRFEAGGAARRYIHQRINHEVFREPEKLMENIERVTRHLRSRIKADGGNPDRETLNLIHGRDGGAFIRGDDGTYWRTYLFIEGARTYDVVEDINHVRNAAGAFGRFQLHISDLPGRRLHETIPDFHNTVRRFENFRRSLDADPANRAARAKTEVDFVLERESTCSVLTDLVAAGRAPERITHNDTKFNNVMIDDATGEGICVIDLDTVMPGLPMYDFGDCVRAGANPAAEDERDLSKVRADMEMFERIAQGYLDTARHFLTPVEVEHLAFSARLITFEIGMRFLTDFLDGDVYFKVHREEHNLDRCRTQFKMVADMEREADRMEQIVRRYASMGR